jgi:dTDP-4-amino-4,6-dideoxygalactose transaminase
MHNIRIPFNKASPTGLEMTYIAEAVTSGHIAGDGPFTRKCRELLESQLNVPLVLITTSCTHALEMSAMLIECHEGDEVIFPSFTFVSTVNAFVLRGVRPVFADVRPDTLNLDETVIEALITPATKAIVPMHYAGVGCEMDSILEIANRHGLKVIEDNSHGLFGRYKGRYLGTFGCMATQSFHETKNFTCGEGGALLINDIRYIERAEIIREKGTNRSRFFRGEVDKYTWIDIGSSYLPSDILAAFLYAQLESRLQIQEKRRWLWENYLEHLGSWALENGVSLPFIPEHCEQSFHTFYMLMPSLEVRTNFIAFLKTKGIQSVFHYLPLHLSDMGLRFVSKAGSCPVTEDISNRLVRLPFYNSLSSSELEEVIDVVRSFRS